jgi:hypothetical protein
MDPVSDMRANMALALSPLHGIAQNYRDRAAQEREDRLLKEERAFKREMLDAEIQGRRSIVDAEIQGRKDVAGLEHDFRSKEAKKSRKHDKKMFDRETDRRRKDRKQRLKDEAARRKEELRNNNRMLDDAALKKKGGDVGLDPVYFTNEDGDFDRIAYADALGTEQIRKVQYLEEKKGRIITELMSSDSGQRDVGISGPVAALRKQAIQQIAGNKEVFDIIADKLGEKEAYDLTQKLALPLDQGGITLKTIQGMIVGKRGWLGQGDKYQKAARLDQILSEEMNNMAPSVLDAESKKLLQEDMTRKQLLMKEVLQLDNEVAGIRQAMGAAHAEILAQAEESMGNQPNSYQAMVAAINAENKTVAHDPDDETDPEDPGSAAPENPNMPEKPNMPEAKGVSRLTDQDVLGADLDEAIKEGSKAIAEEKAANSLWIDRNRRIQGHVEKREVAEKLQSLINKLKNPTTETTSFGPSAGPGGAPSMEVGKRALTHEEKLEILSDIKQLRDRLRQLQSQEGPATIDR